MVVRLLPLALLACGSPSRCEKLVGTLAELEKLTGLALEMQSGNDARHGCYQYVGRKATVGKLVVDIEANRASFDDAVEQHSKRAFTDRELVGEALLFVAGDPTAVATGGADPPPVQHVALLRAGDTTVKVMLDREAFTVDQAKSYVEAIAARAR